MKTNKTCLGVIVSVILLSACGGSTPTVIPSPTPRSPTPTQPSTRTPTGFYWPTGTNGIGDYPGFLANGCFGHQTYKINLYHIGQDIVAGEGDLVYAISAGQIFHISENGWNYPDTSDTDDDNIALLIHHKLSDGTDFMAVYGHIESNLQNYMLVTAGQRIGTIGPYGTQPHLHFGIRPWVSTEAPYGFMTCPDVEPIIDTNGFVDPITWIMTRIPGEYTLPSTITPTAASPQGTLSLLVDNNTPGYYNDALGTMLDGTQIQFPPANSHGSEEPEISDAPKPDLDAAELILGDWLSANPLPLNSNWSDLGAIPMTWPVNTESAIIYPIDAGTEGYTHIVGNFGVDNGLFVWVNGVYRFGATAAGAVGGFEYVNVDLGSLNPGLNFIQILREDHSDITGFTINITGTP